MTGTAMKRDIIEQLRRHADKNIESVYEYLVSENLVPADLAEKIIGTPKYDIVSEHYPYDQKLSRSEYEKEKLKLQIELVKLQRTVKRKGLKIVILFEGRDAAGKGGSIKRLTEHLNPRGARVVALEKPTETERGQWYFQRYARQLPTSGEIVFFDRSWYNRAGVEKVMDFCSEQEYMEFVSQAPAFEGMLLRSSISLIKFWFSVSREEQLRRFVSRITDPLKQWKISPMDLASLSRWREYTESKESMFFFTDGPECPWRVVRSDCKKRARLNVMRYFLDSFDYKGKDEEVIGKVDPKILGPAEAIYEPDELIHREVFKGTARDLKTISRFFPSTLDQNLSKKQE